jgi:predicted DNA-binding protein
MRSDQEQVFLSARIPFELKVQLAEYCKEHGIKMNFLITTAIKEKLLQIAEDEDDIALAKERLKDGKFLSSKEFNKYLRKRGIKP